MVEEIGSGQVKIDLYSLIPMSRYNSNPTRDYKLLPLPKITSNIGNLSDSKFSVLNLRNQ
jgi:hypothetical protein